MSAGPLSARRLAALPPPALPPLAWGRRQPREQAALLPSPQIAPKKKRAQARPPAARAAVRGVVGGPARVAGPGVTRPDAWPADDVAPPPPAGAPSLVRRRAALGDPRRSTPRRLRGLREPRARPSIAPAWRDSSGSRNTRTKPSARLGLCQCQALCVILQVCGLETMVKIRGRGGGGGAGHPGLGAKGSGEPKFTVILKTSIRRSTSPGKLMS